MDAVQELVQTKMKEAWEAIKPMTKAELVTNMAGGAGITKAQAEAALRAFTTSVAQEAMRGGKLNLVGFGTFSRQDRKARTARNPQTGATVQVPAKSVLKFSASKEALD